MLQIVHKQGLMSYYHVPLVILSVLIGIFTSYVALNLLIRNLKHVKRDKPWLILATLVLGGGIWALHFIGMLAFHMEMTITYNVWLVIVSLLTIFLFSGISLFLISSKRNTRTILVSGFLLAFGTLAMHYISMESMQMEADIVYEFNLLVLAFIVAFLASVFSFWFLSGMVEKDTHKPWKELGTSIVLGVGISSMHYIGISAANFEEHHHPTLHQGGNVLSDLNIAVSITFFLLATFLMILFTSIRDEQYRRQLKESQEHYSRFVEFAPVGILIHKFGVIHYINPSGKRILGTNLTTDIVGRHFLEFIHPDYHDIIRKRWDIIREESNQVETIEEKMIRVDETIIDVEVSTYSYKIKGETYVQIFFSDISARKEAERKNYHMAFHDPLTDLPNRRFFTRKLNQAIKASAKSKNAFAVLFIDLDGFKQVNDTYGHDVGDLLLQHVSIRLMNCLQDKDTLSRFGGDEFNILLEDTTFNHTKMVAEKIVAALQNDFQFDNITTNVTPSIGIAFYPTDGETPELLLKYADEAMFEAKRQGKNNYCFYHENNKYHKS
ncbi:diguanylate cyclase domain-containing protein [Fredinandcohnia humi]